MPLIKSSTAAASAAQSQITAGAAGLTGADTPAITGGNPAAVSTAQTVAGRVVGLAHRTGGAAKVCAGRIVAIAQDLHALDQNAANEISS